MLRAVTAAMGMAIVNGQRFAEAWTYGRPEKRPRSATPGRRDDAWLRTRVFAIQVHACSRKAQERKSVTTVRDV